MQEDTRELSLKNHKRIKVLKNNKISFTPKIDERTLAEMVFFEADLLRRNQRRKVIQHQDNPGD